MAGGLRSVAAMHRRCFPIILLLLGLLVALPAAAQTELLPGYPDRAALGPARAKGAIIWNHGRARLAEAAGETPYVLDDLQAAGWDVFRLQRKWAADHVHDSTQALIATAEQLRGQGYKRIVSAGQSFGGWISYAASGRTRDLFHAILATAPAAHGEVGVSTNWRLNADGLYDLASGVNPTRVMTFLFERDSYDPGGRGERLRNILTGKRVPNVIVERPPGLAGHGAGQTIAFARIYGACVLAFIEAAEPPASSACPSAAPAFDPRDFVLPGDIAIAPPPLGAPEGLAGLSGRWFGWFDNGQLALVIVERARPDGVQAIYAWSGRIRGGSDRPGHLRRAGSFDAASSTLRLAEPGKSTQTYKLRPDGGLDASWTRADGGLTFTSVFRKLD